jgi:threonine dehydratase
VLSGGNVDETVLAAIARRSGAAHGRGAVLFTKISDKAGSLARLLEAVADTGASVVDVQHVRDAVDLHVSETGVELILETRGTEHTDRIVGKLQELGYEVERQHTNEG